MKPQYRLEPKLTPRAKDSIGIFPKRKPKNKISPSAMYELASGVMGFAIVSCTMGKYRAGEIVHQMWGNPVPDAYICIGNATRDEWDQQNRLVAAEWPEFSTKNSERLATMENCSYAAFVRERK